MVAFKGQAVDAFVARPDPRISAILVYGPDRGLVSERCRALLAHYAEDPDDPFAVSILDEADIAQSAQPLIEELNAIAFGAGRRTVLVRSASGAPPPTLAEALSAPREGVLLVEAGDLKPSSAARKAFEAAKDAAALPCYIDTPKALGHLVDRSLAEMKQTITAEARETLLARLGADRLASRAELEKLMLYAGEGAHITAADVDEATADAGELTLDALADAVGEGQLAAIEHHFERATEAGMASARILGAMIRHFIRLHESLVAERGGAAPERAAASLRPPVHFLRRKSHVRQMQRWSEDAIREGLALLAAAEADSRGSQATVSAASRALFRLAVLPRPGRR